VVLRRAYASPLTLVAVSWLASVVLLVLAWRSGRLSAHHHRDPPFTRPTLQQPSAHDEDDEEDGFTHIPSPNRQQTQERPYGSDRPYDNDVVQNPFSDPQGRYSQPSSIPAAGRPSMDAYGAFSDPAPSGFGSGYGGGGSPSGAPLGAVSEYQSSGGYSPQRATGGAPMLPEPDLGPRVSRTMQYADPYAAVRASVAGASGGAAPPAPPGYSEGYSGYR
jgi:hypothetical protein